MIFARAILGQELILVSAIGLAMALISLYLRQRGHLDLLRRVWLPALLFALFGTLDALVTIVGTWDAPLREGNPTTRAWLLWGGWVGLVIGTFLYVLFWAAAIVGLETLRQRSGRLWASVLGGVQLLILYALAIGHFWGFLTWTSYYPAWGWNVQSYLSLHAPWLYAISPLGYGIYVGLVLGVIVMTVHLAIAALFAKALLAFRPVRPDIHAVGSRGNGRS